MRRVRFGFGFGFWLRSPITTIILIAGLFNIDELSLPGLSLPCCIFIHNDGLRLPLCIITIMMGIVTIMIVLLILGPRMAPRRGAGA